MSLSYNSHWVNVEGGESGQEVTYKPPSVPKGLIAGLTRAGLTRAKGEMPVVRAVAPGRPNPVVIPAFIENADVPAMGRPNDVGVATATGGAIAGGITAGAMMGG